MAMAWQNEECFFSSFSLIPQPHVTFVRDDRNHCDAICQTNVPIAIECTYSARKAIQLNIQAIDSCVEAHETYDTPYANQRCQFAKIDKFSIHLWSICRVLYMYQTTPASCILFCWGVMRMDYIFEIFMVRASYSTKHTLALPWQNSNDNGNGKNNHNLSKTYRIIFIYFISFTFIVLLAGVSYSKWAWFVWKR